jgi:hypothetical protein
MFVYNGQSCCSATTAEGKTLKAVFEDMRVATKLNIPGNAMDLELRWTDPEDNLESTWTVRDADRCEMSFFQGQARVKINIF